MVMQDNPYLPSKAKPDPRPRVPLLGRPMWLVVVLAFFLGAAANLGGWRMARDGIRWPRRWAFAPAVVLGVQDMSDAGLGMAAGGLLFAAYAAVVSSARRSASFFFLTTAVLLFHAACLAYVESKAPTYPF